MSASSRYATPAAFRRALTDRLKMAEAEQPWTFSQLQRQVAYDRLLDRLYLVDDGWIVKGATALLARDLGVRGSLDVDLYRQAGRTVAEADLRRAADLALDDWFRFEVGAGVAIGNFAVRLPINALIGATTWVEFHVDLVGPDVVMTGHPDDVPPLARGLVPGVEQRGYRAYPLVDHVADKIAATYERHGDSQRPSTRFRDLVDLAAIVTGASIPADAQHAALQSEFARRTLSWPDTFDVPDRALWVPGYAKEAQRSVITGVATLDEALAVVRAFIDPLLAATAAGKWDPTSRTWTQTVR